MYVYKITNLINNKIYIGITNDYKKRWVNECCPSNNEQVITRAILKYGKENFKFEVLLSGLSIEEASEKEKELIQKENSLRPNGYNIAKGGMYKIDNPMYGEDNGKACLTNEEAQYIKSHRNIPMYVLYDDFSNKIGYDAFKNCYNNITYTNIIPTVDPYPYNLEFSSQFCNAKIDYGDVVKLRKQYQNCVYWKIAYENYKDIYSDWQTFWEIYTGRKFKLVMPEIFTEELKKKHSSIGRQGERNSHAKLNENDVKTIREMHDNGVSNKDIYKKYPFVTPTAIRDVINKKTWKNII